MTPYYSDESCALYHCDWRELAARVAEIGGCDSLIVDAPYSERTHQNHNETTRYDGLGVPADFTPRGDGEYGHRQKTRPINYAPWSADDVNAFVATWAPLTRGWMCSITDHVLGPAWSDAMEKADRYAFAPMPIVEIGSRVRMLGDGPSSWTCWLAVSRPRDGRWLTEWRDARGSRKQPRALPGAYIYSGHGDRFVMGGKRTESLRALVCDYAEPGALIADPCCGGGTALLAARMEGRRAIGGDISEEHLEIAARRLEHYPREHKGQLALLGGDE